DTDIFIAVMGVTGAGKSTFISQLCKEPIAIGHDLQACTSIVDVYPWKYDDDTTVYLIDTPGFDDTNRSDTQVLREIATWLTDSYSKSIQLSGIIYLHRITDVRMQGSAKKNLFMFRKLCGKEALKNVMLVTTMWEKIDLNEGAQREAQLVDTEDFWGWMKSQGSRIGRHMNSPASAADIIGALTSANTRILLSLQDQMVNDHKDLNETDAGIQLEADFAKERQRFEQEVRDLRKEIREAMAAQDQESAGMLQGMEREYEAQCKRLQHERVELQISMEKLHAEKYAKLEADMEATRAAHKAQLERVEEAHRMQQEQARKTQEDLERRLEAVELPGNAVAVWPSLPNSLVKSVWERDIPDFCIPHEDPDAHTYHWSLSKPKHPRFRHVESQRVRSWPGIDTTATNFPIPEHQTFCFFALFTSQVGFTFKGTSNFGFKVHMLEVPYLPFYSFNASGPNDGLDLETIEPGSTWRVRDSRVPESFRHNVADITIKPGLRDEVWCLTLGTAGTYVRMWERGELDRNLKGDYAGLRSVPLTLVSGDIQAIVLDLRGPQSWLVMTNTKSKRSAPVKKDQAEAESMAGK
ncbi:MAG: hypothetical protein M1828_004948, partial [Chrysothrix sp. TS-e1954]